MKEVLMVITLGVAVGWMIKDGRLRVEEMAPERVICVEVARLALERIETPVTVLSMYESCRNQLEQTNG